MAKLLRATSPDGHNLGHIALELIVRIDANGRLVEFKSGDRLEWAYVDAHELKKALEAD